MSLTLSHATSGGKAWLAAVADVHTLCGRPGPTAASMRGQDDISAADARGTACLTAATAASTTHRGGANRPAVHRFLARSTCSGDHPVANDVSTLGTPARADREPTYASGVADRSDAPALMWSAAGKSLRRQVTPGKRLMGLVVISEDGSRLQRGQALVRAAVKFAPWKLAHQGLALDLTSLATSSTQRRSRTLLRRPGAAPVAPAPRGSVCTVTQITAQATTSASDQ